MTLDELRAKLESGVPITEAELKATIRGLAPMTEEQHRMWRESLPAADERAAIRGVAAVG